MNDRDEPPSSPSAGRPAIDIQSAINSNRSLDQNWIRQHLFAAIPFIEKTTNRSISSISLLIVDDARMIELHRKHRGESTTTDVLTFDLTPKNADESLMPIVADIVVCVDEAARRSADLGHPIERELLLYAIHGLLHCAGFDDHTETDFAKIHAEEDRILRAIGVGDTFNARGNDGAAQP